MSDSFDSRAISYTDTYGQRFMREGTYQYNVVLASYGDVVSEYPNVIEVKGAAGDQMEQHSIDLVFEDRAFRPSTERIEIKTGDLVTWTCRQSGAPPFEVKGAADFFHSLRLVNESGYAHAFGTPGEFEWVDVNGSGLRGVVRVHQPDIRGKDAFASWQRQLSTGALVMISGSDAEPAEIDIITGQTVYFAVTKSPGISVTDRRIAEANDEMAGHYDFHATNDSGTNRSVT